MENPHSERARLDRRILAHFWLWLITAFVLAWLFLGGTNSPVHLHGYGLVAAWLAYFAGMWWWLRVISKMIDKSRR
jgi:hypothetical protein